MVKKLVGVSVAAIVAANLWGGVAGSSRKVMGKVKALEAKYRRMTSWAMKADQ